MSETTPAAYCVEPELAAPAPRRVRYSRETRLKRVWLANVFVGLFLGGLWASSADVGFYRRIAAEGVRTSATVLEIRASNSRSGTSRALYAVPGHGRLPGAGDIPSDRYGVPSPGDMLPVTYVPATPTEHVVGTVATGDVERRQARWNLALLLVAAAGALANAAYWGYARGKRRLLTEGVAVPAVVIGRADEIVSRAGRAYSITYRYPSAAGEPVTVRMAVSQRTHDALPEGSAFTVLRAANGRLGAAVPYFALFGVEIPGAAGPKVPV